MEIELLQKKLNFYKSQLEDLNPDEQVKWAIMLEGVERQLCTKLKDLEYKRRNRQSVVTNTFLDNNLNFETEKDSLFEIIAFDKRKEQLDNQINQLNVLSEEEPDNISFTEDSRFSVSTIKTNVSIPNEYDHAINVFRGSPRLSQMMVHHQMQSKPLTDFGKSPGKAEKRLDASMLEESFHLSPEFHYIKLKNKYKELKESMHFPPKNCFNRHK